MLATVPEAMPGEKVPRLEWADLVPYLLARGNDVINLASGNPLVQGEVVEALRAAYSAVVSRADLADIVYRYEDPQGSASLRETLALLYKKQHGIGVTAANVLITPGSQAAFYYISELAARSSGRVHFPNGPEYPGYRTHPLPYAMEKPVVEITGRHRFSYTRPQRAKALPDGTMFVMLSNPGNPTGRVWSREELEALSAACRERNAYLVLDSAYAPPVPNITFVDLRIPWNDRIILVGSFSKAGLAGERLGVIVAATDVIRQLVAVQARLAILAPRLEQFVVDRMLRSGEYQRLSAHVIRPAYEERHRRACAALESELRDDVPYYVFASGGSPFLWIWFEAIPSSTNLLFFELLKEKLILAPSSVFYLPVLQRWPHAHQCVRLGLVEPSEVIERAMGILGRSVRKRYQRHGNACHGGG